MVMSWKIHYGNNINSLKLIYIQLQPNQNTGSFSFVEVSNLIVRICKYKLSKRGKWNRIQTRNTLNTEIHINDHLINGNSVIIQYSKGERVVLFCF